MKTLSVLCVMIFPFASQHCFAQQRSQEEMFYLLKAEKYHRMKNTGRVLTIGGTIVSIVGLVTMMNAPMETTTNGYGQTTTSNDGVGGALAFLAGSAAVGAGVPLWIVGAHAEEKYQKKLGVLSMGLKVNSQQAGLTLRYRIGYK